MLTVEIDMDDASALDRLLAPWFAAFARYRKEDGATTDLDLVTYLLYLAIQNALPVDGDIAELGVLRGGPFALLSTMAKGSERAHAIDVFDLYMDHPDPAKRFGNDPRRFQDTVQRVAGPEARYQMVRADTTRPELAAAVIEQVGRNCRFFHVDGEHRLANIRADLRIADACTRDNARPIIAVDDTFASVLPEVTEGLLEFLRTSGQYSVFLLARNKTYLCRKADHDFYTFCAVRFLQGGLRRQGQELDVRHVNGDPCVALRIDAAPEVESFNLERLRELVASTPRLPRVGQDEQ